MPATLLWRRTLAQIPTVFGRLAYLSSLRNPATGRYAHEALVRLLGPEEADRTLCHSHHQVFSLWLGFSLADQKSDLDEYLNHAGTPWQALHYRHLVPPTDVYERLETHRLFWRDHTNLAPTSLSYFG